VLQFGRSLVYLSNRRTWIAASSQLKDTLETLGFCKAGNQPSLLNFKESLMHFNNKSRFSIAVVFLATATVSPLTEAVILDYTGNTFNSYTPSTGHISISLTADFNAFKSGYIGLSDIYKFTISDGVHSFDKSNYNSNSSFFDLWFTNYGEPPVSWSVNVWSANQRLALSTANYTNDGQPSVIQDATWNFTPNYNTSSSISNAPGTWIVSDFPEPEEWVMLLLGAVMVARQVKKKQRSLLK
jgi:hypothetical protein